MIIFHPDTPTSEGGNKAALVTVVLPFVAFTIIERVVPAAGNTALLTVLAEIAMSVADTPLHNANTASSTSSILIFIVVNRGGRVSV